MSKRKGWTRLSNPKTGTLFQVWRHDASGYEVRHCGHPTALRPYYVTRPDDDRVVVRSDGGAFEWLDAARDAVEGVAAGELKLEMRTFEGFEPERWCVMGAWWDRHGRTVVRVPASGHGA